MDISKMIKVRVYEKEWGGTESDYVTYFESTLEIKKFKLETGNRVEVIK